MSADEFTVPDFALPGPSDVRKAFGNAPRYFANVRNPGVNNFDFSLQKDFKLPFSEQTRLTFQADAFNVLNHAQFAEPVSDPQQPNYHASYVHNAVYIAAIQNFDPANVWLSTPGG